MSDLGRRRAKFKHANAGPPEQRHIRRMIADALRVHRLRGNRGFEWSIRIRPPEHGVGNEAEAEISAIEEALKQG